MTLRAIEGKRAVLERIAAELARLRTEADDIGEGFLAFLLANAETEAFNRAQQAAEDDA